MEFDYSQYKVNQKQQHLENLTVYKNSLLHLDSLLWW